MEEKFHNINLKLYVYSPFYNTPKYFYVLHSFQKIDIFFYETLK